MARTYTPITAEMADYIARVSLREPEALRRLREGTEDHPRAFWQIAPEQGQFLHMLACAIGAKKALEVGVFMGYSSTWVALALTLLRPRGLLVADNVLLHGAVIDADNHDPDTEGIRAFNLKLHQDQRIALSIATMGDGLAVACKLSG